MLTTSETRLSIAAWKTRIEKNKIPIEEMIDAIYEKIDQFKDYNIWIHLVPKEQLLKKLALLKSKQAKNHYPLFGIPFAVKDNIDVAEMPTTAACPAFSYIPDQSAEAVRMLEEAGALMIGKTNLDQFATGLVGTRSPYGAVKNSYLPEYISGGSSSGSAVAVALGMVCFSLGTDTAGSGRVPAGFNNLIGLKPSKDIISTKGVVPACKSLDCVSIFTSTIEDATVVFNLLSPTNTGKTNKIFHKDKFTFAVPEKSFLKFFENREYEILYEEALAKLKNLGGKMIEIDFSPFIETSSLLYEGPWVAERLASIKEFYEKNSDSLLIEIKTILEGAKKFSAVDTFLSQYKLDVLKKKAHELLAKADFLVVPTAPTIYKIDEIKRHPFAYNKNLGYYTNYVNLLDLCALALPAGFQSNGLPMGITLIDQAHNDQYLLSVAKHYQF